MGTNPETNPEFPLSEIKYLGRGRAIHLFVSILLFITSAMFLSIHLLFKTKPSAFDLVFIELYFTLPAIMVNLLGLRIWPIWPRFVRFYNDYMEFIEADAGPITNRKPLRIIYDKIQKVVTAPNESRLLIYSQEFEKNDGHRDIDLNGMTNEQQDMILKQLQNRNLAFEKDSRLTFSQQLEIANKNIQERKKVKRELDGKGIYKY